MIEYVCTNIHISSSLTLHFDAAVVYLLKDGLVQTVPDAFGLEKHAAQATTEEHDGDRHMLHVCGAPLLTPTREMLQEGVVILGDSICENHTRLGELTAPDVGLPLVRGPLAALIQRLDGLTSLSFSKHTNCGGIFSIKEHLIIIKANPMSSVEGPRMWLLPR